MTHTLYEVHERGVTDADTRKPAWYQVHAFTAWQAAELYVQMHARKDCMVHVREWQNGRSHGWVQVEWLAETETARVETETEKPVGYGARDAADDAHKEEQERRADWRQEAFGE